MKPFTLTLFLLVHCSLMAETIHDTTYYAANGAIYTITTYVDSRLNRYEEYYSNGDKKYYVTYEFENDTLRKERLFGPKDKEFAYGTYRYHEKGYEYDYFHKAGKKLQSSSYSLWGYLLQTSELRPNGSVYWKATYEYDSLGWLTAENYYGKDATREARGLWSFDSSSSKTIYHYTLEGDSMLVNQYTGEYYDEYKTYYSTSLSLKDSTEVFYKGEKLYCSQFEWNENGYMLGDKHFDKEGKQTSQGSYTFDSTTFTTKYRYNYLENPTVWETITDYRGVTEETNIFYEDTLATNTQYRYNDLLYVDSVLFFNSKKSALAFENYTYYEPFEWVKSYLYAYPNGDTISYVEYNEDGSISKIVATSEKIVSLKQQVSLRTSGKNLHIKQLPALSGTYRIISVRGRELQRGSWEKSTRVIIPVNSLATGCYIFQINTTSQSGSVPFRIP